MKKLWNKKYIFDWAYIIASIIATIYFIFSSNWLGAIWSFNAGMAYGLFWRTRLEKELILQQFYEFREKKGV